MRQYRFRPVSKPGWVTSWDAWVEPDERADPAGELLTGGGDWDEAARALVDEVNAQVVDDAPGGFTAWSGSLASRSDRDLVAELAETEAQLRAAQAREVALVAAFAARRGGGDYWISGAARGGPGEFVGDHLGLALGVSLRSAEHRIHEAAVLAGRFPKIHAALAAGLVSMPGVRTFLSETSGLSEPGDCAEAEARVLDTLGQPWIDGLGRTPAAEIADLPFPDVAALAGAATPGWIGQLARRAVLWIDADAVRARAEKARESRGISCSPYGAGDGMSWLGVNTDTPRALAGYTRVCDIAEHLHRPLAGQGDPRTLDQVRADVFTDLLLGVPLPHPATDPDDPDDPGPSDPGPSDGPGGDNGPTGDPEPAEPAGRTGVPLNVRLLIDAAGVAHVPGYGIVSCWTVDGLRDLTASTGGRLTTITHHPVRCPGEHPNDGRDDPHDPPPAMRRAVQTRNPVCVFPGCVTVATRCDLDHTIPWPHGPTCPCNLGPLCRHHHRLKTHDPGWHLTNHGNGTFTWTTPSGRTYTVTP